MGLDDFCSINFKGLQKSSFLNFKNTDSLKEVFKTYHILKFYVKFVLYFKYKDLYYFFRI